MSSVTINKPSNGAKGIIEFFKATVSPKPRAEGSSPSAPARQILAFGGNLSAKSVLTGGINPLRG